MLIRRDIVVTVEVEDGSLDSILRDDFSSQMHCTKVGDCC